MGTTITNLHVYVGRDAAPGVHHTVASFVPEAALVAPPADGWVSVYPADRRINDDALALHVSSSLDEPVVDFWCFDSDFAAATLTKGGVVLDSICVAPTGELKEFGADAARAPITHSGRYHDVLMDIGVWLALDATVTREDIEGALRAMSDEPFAEAYPIAVLGTFGLGAEPLTLDYVAVGDVSPPEVIAEFVRAPTPPPSTT